MPFGNGRGPQGLGPMTGRAAGFCAGYSVPGYMNSVPGRGFYGSGFGRGGGRRGHRNWFHATGLTRWQRAAGGYPHMAGPAHFESYSEPYYAGSGYTAYTKEDQINDLKQHAQHLEGVLAEIRKQIDELETK